MGTLVLLVKESSPPEIVFQFILTRPLEPFEIHQRKLSLDEYLPLRQHFHSGTEVPLVYWGIGGGDGRRSEGRLGVGVSMCFRFSIFTTLLKSKSYMLLLR